MTWVAHVLHCPPPPRSLVLNGHTSPHRPRLVVSHSTCPPLSPSPHANSFVIGTAGINTHACDRGRYKTCDVALDVGCDVAWDVGCDVAGWAPWELKFILAKARSFWRCLYIVSVKRDLLSGKRDLDRCTYIC